jgi:G protein-coupled receptor 157
MASSPWANIMNQGQGRLPVAPDAALRVVLSITCSLSIIGSVIIIISYIGFKSLRTTPRQILLHISIMDLGVGISNLVGLCVNFNQYYFNIENATFNENGWPILNDVTPAVRTSCIVQAATAVYFTVGSFLWTISMAIYLYLRIVHYQTYYAAKCSYIGSIVICYTFPLLFMIWKLLTHRLGYAPYSTEGWCGDKLINLTTGQRQTLLNFIGYEMWVLLAFILLPILYVAILCYIYQELKISQKALNISKDRFWTAVHNLDYKLLLIPLAFLLLRVWSLIDSIIYVYAGQTLQDNVHKPFVYLSGIGDSGQGFVNGILFILLTKKVRQKIIPCNLLWEKKKRNDTSEYLPIVSGIQKEKMEKKPSLLTPTQSLST